MTTIDYEAEVKRVYPEAELQWWPRSETWTIKASKYLKSQHIHADGAWRFAYYELKQQGLI